MRWPLFLVKLFNYEYWPWWALYIPILPYIGWLAFRARSVSFFTAVDPCMPMGGLLGESKKDIFKIIPKQYLPQMLFVPKGSSFMGVQQELAKTVISFPLIAKPNVGERGFMVAKILDIARLEVYHNTSPADYVIQEFIDMPIELGIFWVRMAGKSTGVVSSVTSKEFLSVTGDGVNSILALLQLNTRARFQIKSMQEKLGDSINSIPDNGKILLLEPIGNHCRGTRFINANYLINEQLQSLFNDIAQQMTGFDYGRFDLKVASIADLYAGRNIRILELNGVSSEPGHIYDQSTGLFSALKCLAWHWKQLYMLSIDNKEKGLKPYSPAEVLYAWRNHIQ